MRITRVVLALVLGLSMALGFFSVLAVPSASAAGPYTPHAPIRILSNAGFTAANGVVSGDGSMLNPYIIEGWDIDASAAMSAGIEISSTDSFFTVRNVRVSGGLGEFDVDGIELYNNKNAVSVADCEVHGNYIGIMASKSQGVRVTGNNASYGNTVGILVSFCNGTVVSDNVASANTRFGIDVHDSANATITRNCAFDNIEDGITVEYQAYTLIEHNSVRNSQYGINLNLCTYGTVRSNDIQAVGTGTLWVGIRLLTCTQCEVSDNIISTRYEGVHVSESSYGLIRGNEITNEPWSGATIGLWNAYHFDVVMNNVTGGLWGVWCAGVEDVLVDHNSVSGCTYGIGISRSMSNSSINAERVSVTGNSVSGLSLRGIDLMTGSIGCNVSGNTITGTGGPGVYVEGAVSSMVSENTLVGNTGSGIVVEYLSTTGTTIVANEISGNAPYGIELRYCSQTKVYHNNLINNTVQALQNDNGWSVVNSWDDGYPSGGNYWSDYAGSDAYSGAAQNEPGSDSIGDELYMLDLTHKDSYPLMQPWNGSLPPPPPPVPGRQVNVSEGTSVTVYEMTGWMNSYTYDLYTLTHGGGVFWTVAMLEEKYTVTSDGEYLTIHCYRNPPYPCSGTGVGNNIAAVKLNGVPGFDEGIWASFIVDYTVGTEGTAESRFNALGNDTQLGPYLNSPCTYLGDYDSELVLGFSAGGVVPAPPVEASIDFDMNSFNPTSKGVWVTAYIGLPEGYSVNDIDISTVMLNDAVPANGPSEVKDFDHDGVLELMVKFDRKAALETMVAATDVEVTVSGSLNNGTEFLGTDNITVQTGKLISAALVGSLIGALAAEPGLTAIIILVFVCLLAIAVARPFTSRRKTH